MPTSPRILSRLVVCLATASAVIVPALHAGAAPARPDAVAASSRPVLGKFLKVSLHFTKDRYAPHQKAHVVVTLRNGGTAKLHHIGAACDRMGDPSELNNTGSNWGALAAQGPGVTLAAHETRTVQVTAKVPAAAQRSGSVAVVCDFGYVGDDNGYRPVARDSAKVRGRSGAVAGDFYYYLHGHSGTTEGLKNVRVELVDPTRCPVLTRSATSSADGEFRISHVAAGSSYRLYLYPPKGWKVPGHNPTNVEVVGTSTARVVFEAVRGSRPAPHVPRKCS